MKHWAMGIRHIAMTLGWLLALVGGTLQGAHYLRLQARTSLSAPLYAKLWEF